MRSIRATGGDSNRRLHAAAPTRRPAARAPQPPARPNHGHGDDQRRRHGTLVAGPAKTGKLRTVLIPGARAAMLEEHLAAHPNPSGHVFGAREGGPRRYHNSRRRSFAPALENAALGRPVCFHDLRHRHAAMLIAQRQHAKAILEADLVGRVDDTLPAIARCHRRATTAPALRPRTRQRPPKGPLNCGNSLERTTGFEPATLTLAR